MKAMSWFMVTNVAERSLVWLGVICGEWVPVRLEGFEEEAPIA